MVTISRVVKKDDGFKGRFKRSVRTAVNSFNIPPWGFRSWNIRYETIKESKTDRELDEEM